MKKSLRNWSIRLFVLIVLAAGAFAGWRYWQTSTAKTLDERYQFEVLAKGDVVQTVTANGTLNPVVLVSVGTQVSGTVRKQLLERGEKLRLVENLARPRCFIALTQVRKQNLLRVRPFLDLLLVLLDAPRTFLLHRIAVGHLHRGRKHVLERKFPIFSQHGEKPADRARSQRRQRTFAGRIAHSLGLEEFNSCTRGSDAKSVDSNNFLSPGIVDERLSFPAPRHIVIHGADGTEHGTGRIHRVSAALEHARTRGGTERFSSNRDPMTAMKRRTFGARIQEARSRRHYL